MTAPTNPPRAVVLLSGGLDSATCLLLAREEAREAHALSFDYGQRHAIELSRARELAARYGAASHRVLRLELPQADASALTNRAVAIPAGALGSAAIPPTYVPGRNTIFLAFAMAWAEPLGADEIFIGANALDYSGYPDCRPDYLEAFEAMSNLATRAGVESGRRLRIRAPLLRMSKAEIVRAGSRLGLDFRLTSSCYDPAEDGKPCKVCDSCLLRAKGFREAGISDPSLEQITNESA